MSKEPQNPPTRPATLATHVSDVLSLSRLVNTSIADALKPIHEIQRIHRDAVASIQPFLEIQNQIRKITDIHSSQLRAITEAQKQVASLYAALANVPNLAALIRQHTAQHAEISRKVGDFARIIASNDLGPILRQVRESLHLHIPSEDALAVREKEPEDQTIRDALFGELGGIDYTAERDAVTRELKQAGRKLSTVQIITKVVLLSRETGSPKLRGYCVSVALNLLSSCVEIGIIWRLLIVFLILTVDFFTPAQARSALRQTGCVTTRTRIVRHDCIVFAAPKKKAKRIDFLPAGTPVEAAHKISGWQQVYFADLDNQQFQIGWVKSKYLESV